MTDYDAKDDRFVPTRFDTFNGLGRLWDPERDDDLNFSFTLVPDKPPGAIIISDFMTGGIEHGLALPQDVVLALINAARAITYDWRRRHAKPGDRPRDSQRRIGRAREACLACSATGWIVLDREWIACPNCLIHDAA